MLQKESRWTDKGDTPFIIWSITTLEQFPQDGDGNSYLLVTMDLFSKWVKTYAVPLVHIWRAAKFLYDDVIAH